MQVGNAVPPPMGKALGLEIRKVFGVKMTNEEKIALEAANKIKHDASNVKNEKVDDEEEELMKQEPASSSSSSSGMIKQQIAA